MHGLEVNEAERMVEEMGRRKRKQNQPGADANALEYVTTNEGVHVRRAGL
jgi:hypothetical protein